MENWKCLFDYHKNQKLKWKNLKIQDHFVVFNLPVEGTNNKKTSTHDVYFYENKKKQYLKY